MDPDLELLQRWRDGDNDAGGKLLARHFNCLRVYFLGRVPERQIEDLIQEVMMRMVEARDRFEGRSSVRTFLIRIAQNVAREALREIYRPGGKIDPISESLSDITGRSQSSIVIQDQVLQLMLDAMQRIATDKHDLLELYYFHGFTQRELAELLDTPEGTVKSRIGAARRDLLGEFVNLLGKDAQDWTDDSLDRGLTRVRDAVLRGKPRPPD